MRKGLPRASRAPRTWGGRAFIDIGRALYLGPAADTTPHAHHAIQIACSLEGAFRIRTGEGARWSELEGALVPAGHRHQLEGRGHSLVLLYLEPESADARSILASETSAGIRELASDEVAGLRAAIGSSPLDSIAPPEAALLCERALEAVGTPGHRPRSLDPRVGRAVQRLRDPLSPPGSLAALARELGLSTGRLRHLFAEQMGLSPRRYVLWLRLVRAVGAAARARSLTEVAAAAGFSDAAHLSRTMRRMFGIPPSAVLPAARASAGPSRQPGTRPRERPRGGSRSRRPA